MPSPRTAIKQADITRTVKAVVAAGLSVVRVEVEGGKLVVITNQDVQADSSPLESWRAKHGSRKA